MSQRFLFDRRSGKDRRKGKDPRRNPRLDLPHKRRRKIADRRSGDRTLTDDFYAASFTPVVPPESSRNDTKH